MWPAERFNATTKCLNCLRSSHWGSGWITLNNKSKSRVHTEGRRVSFIHIPVEVQMCQPTKCISLTLDQVKCRLVCLCMPGLKCHMRTYLTLFLDTWCHFLTGEHNMHFLGLKSCTSECFWWLAVHTWWANITWRPTIYVTHHFLLYNMIVLGN